MMPNPGRHIGHVIGFATLHRGIRTAVAVTGPPTAIFQLSFCQPGVGTLCGMNRSSNTQTHCGLSVIPWIGVSPVKPGDFSRSTLVGKQKLDRRAEPLRGESPQTGKRRVHWRSPPPSGLEKYITTLFPISGFNTASTTRVSHGRRIKSHTSNL